MPIAYASRALSKSEQNYAMIEKELLGVVFGCERFHSHVYGRSITVETDHKPLIAINNKPLCDAPPRLQRLMLRIQKYDLEMIHTRKIVIADTLSRSYLPLPPGPTSTEDDVEIHVCAVISNLMVTTEKWKEIANKTQKDETLQKVIQSINSEHKICPKPYSTFVDELSVVDGVLLKQQTIVIPMVMRKTILNLVHEGHMGIEKSKRRARETLYWPKMGDDIYDMISKCSTCQRHRYKQQQDNIQPHERPENPWVKVGCDLFYFNNRHYLLVVDYYSHYPEIALINHESSAQVITHMKSIFSRHGIPQIVMSDGGPCFTSREFQQFSKLWGFQCVRSSPHYPRSNGLAENCVKIVKRLLSKTLEQGEDLYLALMAYRDTPLVSGKSPAQLLFNRKLNTRLPSVELWRQRYSQQSSSNDRKDLPQLHPNQLIRVQSHRMRKPQWPDLGRVIRKSGPRSYDIETNDGRLLTRNRQHLLWTMEPSTSEVQRNEPDVSISEKQTLPRYPQRQRKAPERLDL